MSPVINDELKSNHSINKYNFKVLVADSINEKDKFSEENFNTVEESQFTKETHPERRESDIDASSLSVSSKDSLIESLMKKTDEMSSNFIKLQMKLEDMQEAHQKELEKLKEETFAEGLEAGILKSKEDEESQIADGLKQFGESVATLESSAKEFDKALEGIKNDLISAALDIAKEVITIELNENSQNVAKVLSQGLIKELQSASKVKLKVNPKDHGVISESVGSLEHVEVISDSAVSVGGVIAISDAGNIDSEISKRFQRVKRAALSE